MKKYRVGFIFLGLAVGSLFSFQQNVLAKEISGQVVSVNPKAQQVTIEKKVPVEERGQWVTIHIDPQTNLNGVKSLQDLEIGEEVKMETARNFFFGPWRAESLTVTKNLTSEESGSSQPAVPSLSSEQVSEALPPGAPSTTPAKTFSDAAPQIEEENPAVSAGNQRRD